MSSVINVRLNEKMTLQFVELYRDQRLLWDKEHEAYNKRTDRLRAYRRIADGMAVEGLGVPEVASKIKNIRSTYLQELKKIKDSAQRHLAQSEDDEVASPYVPKLLWFPIIDAMIGGAAVKRLYSSPSTAEMLSIDYAEEDDCSSFDFNYSCEDNSVVAGDDAICTAGKRHHHHPPDDALPSKRLMFKQSIQHFAKYIGSSLDSMSPKLAVQAQMDLHATLVKYKLMSVEQDPC